jgi:hypothetical protein
MAKKFSKLSLLLWGGVLLAVLFFVFGVSRVKEGICVPAGQKCDDSTCYLNCCSGKSSCKHLCKNPVTAVDCSQACVCT